MDAAIYMHSLARCGLPDVRISVDVASQLVLLLLPHLPVPYSLPVRRNMLPHGVPPCCCMGCLASRSPGYVRRRWCVPNAAVPGVRCTPHHELRRVVRAARVARDLQSPPPTRACTRTRSSGDR